MSLKLFEVAGTHIFSMSAIVMVLFFVFAIIVVGYLLGKINIKGVSLGTAARECQGQAGADAGHFCRKAVPVLCPVPAGSDLAGIPHGKADRHSGDAGKCHHMQLFCHGEKYEA